MNQGGKKMLKFKLQDGLESLLQTFSAPGVKNSTSDKDDLLARLRTTRNALKGVYEVSSLATNSVGQTVVTAPNRPKLLGHLDCCFVQLGLELHIKFFYEMSFKYSFHETLKHAFFQT